MKKSYKDIKICVYAITADEPENFIDRWLDSMKGADYITVLITKENNPNYNYFLSKQSLPEFKDKLIVEEKEINPWRFDVARNESMKLIPADTDVCVCTDIDEILIEDFWDDLRKEVFDHPKFERIYYQYAWSHDSQTGEPKWYFWYDKVHKPVGWHWEYPVHEALRCPNIKELGYEGCYSLNANKIYLHHYPDESKSRGDYITLLQMREREYPEDVYGLYYLAREYGFHSDIENNLLTALKLFTRLLGNKSTAQAQIDDDMRLLPATAIMIGDCYRLYGMAQEAEFFYKRSIEFDPASREGYIKLAQLYANQPNKFNDCYKTLDEMHEKAVKTTDWRYTDYYWRQWKELQILADASCWEGNYIKALDIILNAIKDIKTDSDRMDASKEGLFDDLRFIISKVSAIQ